MHTSPKDKLWGIEEPIRMKLCLYYAYGPVDFKVLVPLFNEKYAKKLTVKRFKDAYGHMHDTKDEFFVEARDMDRDNRKQLVNILKDELSYPDDKLREPIIPPVRPMAGLRTSPRNKQKKKSRAATSKIV